MADEQSGEALDTRRWAELATRVLEAEGIRGDMEMSLLFVDQESIAVLNQRFLDRPGPTDVLAFPIDDDMIDTARLAQVSGPASGPGGGPDPDDLPGLLGDVVICPTVARRNAELAARSFDDEIALLVVHGILHLLGMDHAEQTEAEAMEQRERDLLARFHAPPPQPAGAVGHE